MRRGMATVYFTNRARGVHLAMSGSSSAAFCAAPVTRPMSSLKPVDVPAPLVAGLPERNASRRPNCQRMHP